MINAKNIHQSVKIIQEKMDLYFGLSVETFADSSADTSQNPPINCIAITDQIKCSLECACEWAEVVGLPGVGQCSDLPDGCMGHARTQTLIIINVFFAGLFCLAAIFWWCLLRCRRSEQDLREVGEN